ncbi:MAG: glycosyltransferase family 4 protein [Candidatus Berkelbacteria bacterium]|nr:glycosyltransferase family 4 protein [Candidatus Berkelbacteria bacterium]
MDSKTKTKIIQVIADSAIGGGPRHVLGLLNNIDKAKFDVLLIAPRGWLTTEAMKIKDIKVKIVEFASKWDLSSFTKLKKDIAEFRKSGDPFAPIIIHAHGPRAGSFCRLAVRHGEKLVYTEHIWSADYHLKNPINSILQRAGLKAIYHRSDLVIAVSKSVKSFANKLGVDERKIRVIPNAVQVEDTERKSSHDGLLVGTIGSLNRQKGHIYLIEAFKRVVASLPKSRLEIVGDGPEKEKLLAKIQELDLEKYVQLLGRDDKPKKYLDKWDLFVLPSLSETFGLVILEAFQSRVPVVATRVGGIPELIIDDKTGYLVPPADSEKLAKAISYLLVEKKNRESLANEAYELLKKDYDWSKIIKVIEVEYQKLTR